MMLSAYKIAETKSDTVVRTTSTQCEYARRLGRHVPAKNNADLHIDLNSDLKSVWAHGADIQANNGINMPT